MDTGSPGTFGWNPAWRLEREPAAEFTGVLGANVFNNFAAFLITVYAARAFGPEEFGRLALAISITTMLSLILDLV